MIMRWCGLLALSAALGMLPCQATRAGEPVPVIFDTDICGDCDDVLALAMLHNLESRGYSKLIAVTISADHDQAAPFVDAMNTFFGKGEVPIGVVTPPAADVHQSKFLHLADQKDGDALRFPHDLRTKADAPSAVRVLREALASQNDGSVVVIQVGFSTNLARLLESKPDEVSPLSGMELVKRKVKLLSLMAGAFQPIGENAAFEEYNVVKDIPSAQVVAERWPSPMLWSGFEIGIALPYPSQSILEDYGYVAHHPVAEVYIAYNPPPHNRPTWDLTSVLAGVLPSKNYFALSEPGRVTVGPTGTTTFTAESNGPHRYLILRDGEADRVTEALVWLSSEPPKTAGTSR
jgi:purine nucleosidase